MVGCIIGTPPTGFNVANADTNGDGIVDRTDVETIVIIIINK